ncbi:MAG: penicillin-binding protein 2 [Chloroflexota bacterium]
MHSLEEPFQELELPSSHVPRKRSVPVRLVTFYLLVVLVFVGFAMRMVSLQTSVEANYELLSDENRLRLVRENAPRGLIYDRNGVPLVRNIPSYNVTAIPAYVSEDDDAAQQEYTLLSQLIDAPVATTTNLEAGSGSKYLFQSPGSRDLSEPSPASVEINHSLGIKEIIESATTFEPYQPTLIKADVSREVALKVEEMRPFLEGIQIEVVPIRDYPTGDLTSHLVGYMGPLPNESYLEYGYDEDDRVGYAGVEAVFEAELSGHKGETQIEVDVAGKPIRDVGHAKSPVAGLNVHLTIDLDLQAAAYDAISKILDIVDRRWGIKLEQGVVIAMDPRDGQILAMVSIPNYDNNRFASYIDLDYYQSLLENIYNPLVNHAITGQYPPGSTFKLVTASGALQDQVVNIDTWIEGEGTVHLENKYAPNDPGQAQPFYCWYREGHGHLNIVGAIAQSCNIFFYKVGGGFPEDRLDGLGEQSLAQYAEQFGYGANTGIELTGEATGHIPTARWKRLTYGESWSTGDTYNMAVGQGFVTATPLQVLNMAATVANGGTLYQPSIVHHLSDATGSVTRVDDEGNRTLVTDELGNPILYPSSEEEMSLVFEPEVIRWLEVDPENIALVQEGMRQAVADGTAEHLSLDEYGIHVAAKTGTAEFCDSLSIRRGWCREGWPLPTHAWTVAYAPYESPEIAVMAFVYNGGEGSAIAVPIVREFLESYFEIEN